ncbi:MAG: hypothetical protein COX19_16600 [Desulfobacterales bacterium CG23_combo_of_CG06-09_8_20_14_all_51_8]|nr:MAG: hypothetical protein COX19_16600 [Desulfobacterales bacterium CG23_combo_of_CG06-09_8_20_14_all_51_8]
MKKTKFSLKQLIICVLIPAVFWVGSPAFCEEPEFRVTIKGTIANIADVGEYISGQTLLRLYPCETTGKLNVQMNDAGKVVQSPGQPEQKFYLDGFNRLVPQSELSAIGLPVFGAFNFFKARGLEPGRCYKICVLMLDPPYTGMVALTDGEGKPLEIIIPESETKDPGKARVVDLTKTPLMIPGLEKR